jgi:phytoene dehydrogenase-like protein
MDATDMVDVVVVGGGLAGLTAATILGRAGRSVVVFERARELGGRARMQAKEGFLFDLGPHALYRGGPGMGVLRELGIAFHGAVPPITGYAVQHGVAYRLPSSPLRLLTSRLLRPASKMEAARLLLAVSRGTVQAQADWSVEEWLNAEVRGADLRGLLRALLRVFTYTADTGALSATAALAQMRAAIVDNVLYLDGGWQTLVDGLAVAARRSGVRLRIGTPVVAIERVEAGYTVRLKDGQAVDARDVVIAASPAVASSLVDGGAHYALGRLAAKAQPTRMACLDLALEHLPRPAARFAVGIDQPLYFSVPSATARLAPAGGALIHVARYLPGDAVDPDADRQELEAFVDLLQPGWREAVVARRWLPRLTVSHALVRADAGGVRGRLGPAVPGSPHLYVAGDWVGPAGMLADASFASAKQAAEQILAAPSVEIAGRSSCPPMVGRQVVVEAMR